MLLGLENALKSLIKKRYWQFCAVFVPILALLSVLVVSGRISYLQFARIFIAACIVAIIAMTIVFSRAAKVPETKKSDRSE